MILSSSRAKVEGNGRDILANRSPPHQACTTLPAKVQFHKMLPVFSLFCVIYAWFEGSLDTTNIERRDSVPQLQQF